MRLNFLITLLSIVSVSAARNPFTYEYQEINRDQESCIAEGTYEGIHIKLVRNEDGDVTLMVEKEVPSTLGKAEGLGG